MGFLKGISKKLKRNREELPSVEEMQASEGIKREQVDMHDKASRERYVNACLEQIAEASKELETLESEYQVVTSKLTDMEEIDRIAPEIKEKIDGVAKQIVEMEQSQQKNHARKSIMPEQEYVRMERIAEFMPNGLQKVKEAEEFQVLVKRDLSRLDGERQAYIYRKNELEKGQKTMKGMTVICLSSMVLLMLILAVISQKMQMDVMIGYVIAVFVAAVSMTLVFVKYGDSKRELLRVEKTMNKLILLQNTVKIRYVNNTNLLEYLYMKYDIDSYQKLQKSWNKYEQERDMREAEAKLRTDLDEMQNVLINMLRKCNIQDARLWLCQARAIYDSKEMVEIRHGLILSRQKLRKQMEYNAKIAQEAQDEIKDIVEKYPEYAKKILDMVAQYEEKIA